MENIDPKNIQDLLKTPKTKLGWLIGRAKMMGEIETLIHDILGEPLAKYTRVLNYDKGVLMLTTDQSSHATQLRFQSRDIINRMHFYPKWGRLYKIDVTVKADGAAYRKG